MVALVCGYRCPTGVEWQGLFEDCEEDEDPHEGDYGHYSIVTRIDRRGGLITLRDPYPDFWREDRVFRLEWFIRRWWDVNTVPAPEIGALRLVEDRHMLFVIAGARAFSGLPGHDAGQSGLKGLWKPFWAEAHRGERTAGNPPQP
jgi:hypothetical protein